MQQVIDLMLYQITPSGRADAAQAQALARILPHMASKYPRHQIILSYDSHDRV